MHCCRSMTAQLGLLNLSFKNKMLSSLSVTEENRAFELVRAPAVGLVEGQVVTATLGTERSHLVRSTSEYSAQTLPIEELTKLTLCSPPNYSMQTIRCHHH